MIAANRPSPTTPLIHYLHAVYAPDRVNLSLGTVAQIDTSLRIFGRFLGSEPTINDLDETNITRFLTAYSAGQVPGQKRVAAAATVKSKRRDLVALWNTAWERRHTRKAPRKIACPRQVRRQPEAYSLDQMRDILSQTDQLHGTIGGRDGDAYSIDRRLWWKALILTCYSTAARIGALLESLTVDYNRGFLYLRAETQKQRADQTVRPSPEAITAIGEIYDPDRPTLFWWPYGRRWLYQFHKKYILDPAGIRSTRRGMDQFQKYRRTGLSYVAAQNEDQAVKLAGHGSPVTTRRGYLDPTIVNPQGASMLVPSLSDDPPDDPDGATILRMADFAG